MNTTNQAIVRKIYCYCISTTCFVFGVTIILLEGVSHFVIVRPFMAPSRILYVISFANVDLIVSPVARVAVRRGALAVDGICEVSADAHLVA